jgi:archaellum biogenesis ATPase FlaH
LDETGGNYGTIASSHVLEFTADGVIQLWHDAWEGEYHRTLHITKMRSTDHDQRTFVIALGEDGMRVKPRNRSPPSAILSRERVPTGVSELDEMLGGGFIAGSPVSYFHDSAVHGDLFLTSLLIPFLNREYDVVLVPPLNLTHNTLEYYTETFDGNSIETLLSDGSLHVLLPGGNAYSFLPPELTSEGVEGAKRGEILERLQQLLHKTDQDLLYVISCQSLSVFDDEESLRQIITQITADCRGTDHIALFTGVSDLLGDHSVSHLKNATEQIISHERRPNGMETIRVEKGLGGGVGSSRVIEYTTEPPYISIS